MRILTIALSLFFINAYGETEYDIWNEFRKKAEKGDVDAQFQLGTHYILISEWSEAAKWNRMAANQGHRGSQSNLGGLYMNGLGVLKDFVEAYAYLNIAAVNDVLDRELRDKLEKQMTPSQIEAGQKRSKELQKEIEAKIAAKGERK
jgi:hypothetical protein